MKSVQQRTQKEWEVGKFSHFEWFEGSWKVEFLPKSALGAQPETSIIKLSNGSHLKTPAWKTVLPFWGLFTFAGAKC